MGLNVYEGELKDKIQILKMIQLCADPRGEYRGSYPPLR